LEKRGYRILEATNGLEAIEMVSRDCPDLVVMDVNMPIMDGLAEPIWQLNPHARAGFDRIGPLAICAYERRLRRLQNQAGVEIRLVQGVNVHVFANVPR
jgi:CheY-like chemotaxis protein